MSFVKEEKSIKERILEFRKSGEGYDRIISDLSQKAYNYPKRKYGFDEDDCGEFFLYVFPRIKKIPYAYTDNGMSFEKYFNTLLCLRLKTYLYKKMNGASLQESMSTVEFDEENMSITETNHTTNDDSYGRDVIDLNSNGLAKTEFDKKLVLFLALKHARYINPLHVEKLCRITGFCEQWIETNVEDVKTRLARKVRRLTTFIERRNNIYRRIEILRRKQKYAGSPEWKAEYGDRIKRLSRSLANLCDLVSRTSTLASNKVIAEVTGFPKGTVDSSMSRLKKLIARHESGSGKKNVINALFAGTRSGSTSDETSLIA